MNFSTACAASSLAFDSPDNFQSGPKHSWASSEGQSSLRKRGSLKFTVTFKAATETEWHLEKFIP
jgi:hypothetical protein